MKSNNYGGHFDCNQKERTIQELEHQISAPDFWNQDRKETDSVITKLSTLKEELKPLKELKEAVDTNLELIQLLEIETDEATEQVLEEEYTTLSKQLKQRVFICY